MADLTKNINVGVDASGVKTGLQEATKSIKDFGKTVQDESNKGAGGVDRLGESVKKLGPATDSSMKASERAFKGWSSEITRAATQIQAAGDKVKEFELKAQLKGFTPDMYKPQIDALRGVIAEQDRLRASNTNLGMSAAATAAAMRNVPAQFTDIVVSLQAGQAPMTVLLQQGGQLKDMFGGAGNAAKALGGYVLSLINPFTVVASAAAVLAAAYAMGSKENDAFVRAITLSGNATGTTTTQLRQYAREISNVVGTQAQAAEGLAAFVAAGVQGNDQLRQFTQTAIEWEKATGAAVADTAKQFADLQKDPVAAVVKLNEEMNFLTASVYRQIKALDDQGRSADASEVAMSALDAAMRERSKTIKDNLGSIERGWNAIKGAAKTAWDAMLNIGRQETVGDKLAAAQAELNKRMNQPLAVDNEAMRGSREKAIAQLNKEIAALTAQTAAETANAEAKAATAKATEAATSFSKLYDQYKSKDLQRTQELLKAESDHKALLQDTSLTMKERNRIDQEYAEIQKGINDKYADKKKSGRNKELDAENREMERQKKLIGELAGLSSTFYKDWDDLSKAYQKGRLSLEGLTEQQAKLLAKQPFMVEQTKAEAAALAEKVKAYEAEQKAQEAILLARQRAAQSVAGNVEKIRDEIAASRMAYAQHISMARAVEMVALARSEELFQKKLNEGADAATLLALQQEIDKRKELIGLLGEKETFDNFKQSTADATNEAQRMMDEVGNALANSLMDGGKSATEYIKGLLRTLFIKPFVMNIVASVFGLSGGSAAAGAAGVASGGGDLLSLLSMGKNIISAITGGFASLSGQFAGYIQSGMNWVTGSGGMISQGPIQVSPFASGMGAVAAYGAGALGGIYGGRMIGNGYSLNGGSGNGVINAGTAIGAIFGGPLGALLGGLAGGVINRLFGRKLKESGIEGDFGGESGFEGRLYKFYKGGLFRSNKTSYEEMPEEMRSALGNQFLGMDESIRAMAGAVGLGGDALDGFTAKIKVNLKGLSEEEATKKLQEEFQKIAEQMGGLVLTSEEYTRAGETQLEALTRLSTSITLANEWFKAIGDTLYSVSLAGADMASELMDAFGGADKFAAATSNYYDKFYSDQEKVANQTRLLNDALKKLGVESMPTSRDALREYINGIDLSTEAGRKLYAAMIGLADSFDVVYTSAENIAAMKKDLNVQLLRAQGKDDEATKLERAKQLKELEKYKDPELIRMQVEVWNAEDQAKNDAAAKQAAEDLAARLAEEQKAVKDLAMKNLEAAVSREKEYWNQFSADAKEALSKASSYFDLVTNAAKSLRESVEDGSSWAAAAGMVYIEQALANARNGGGLSDLDATKSAIAASTGGLVMDNYATQAELDYDKKVLAGQLDELGGYAALAKTDAQKQIDLATSQLKRLDDTLTFWKEYGEEQVDATMSVTDAIKALEKLMFPEKDAAEGGGSGASSGRGGASFGGGGGSIISGGGSESMFEGYLPDGRPVYKDGSIGTAMGNTASQLANGKDPYSNYPDYSGSGKVVYDEEKGLYVPKLNVGTNYLPSDMLAMVHKGERVIPAADNRALMDALQNQGAGSSNAELIAEVKALRTELQEIKANTASTAQSTGSTSRTLADVTENGNGMRVATMP